MFSSIFDGIKNVSSLVYKETGIKELLKDTGIDTILEKTGDTIINVSKIADNALELPVNVILGDEEKTINKLENNLSNLVDDILE